MIATDLNWFNRNRDYQINDSQYIEVFESHDLVNWSPQRHVKVAPDNAGNAFAPEAYWDDSIGAYVASGRGDVARPVTRTNPATSRCVRDDPRLPHVLRARGVAGPVPQSRIDTTVIKVGDWFYRFTKNEAGNAGSDVFSRSTSSCGTPTWPTGPRWRRRSDAARGSPTRGTRVRWCSRPTRGHGLSRAVLLLGGSLHQRRRLPDLVQRRHRGARVDAKTPRFTNTGTVGTAPSRRSRCASGTASSVSPTRTSPPRPSLRCRPRRCRRASPSSPPRRCAPRTATRPEARSASPPRVAGDRLPRRRHRLGHRARPSRRGPESVTAEYLGYEFLRASRTRPRSWSPRSCRRPSAARCRRRWR